MVTMSFLRKIGRKNLRTISSVIAAIHSGEAIARPMAHHGRLLEARKQSELSLWCPAFSRLTNCARPKMKVA